MTAQVIFMYVYGWCVFLKCIFLDQWELKAMLVQILPNKHKINPKYRGESEESTHF